MLNTSVPTFVRHILVSSESTVSLTDNECVPDGEEFNTNEVLDLYWMKFTKKVLKMQDIYKFIMSSNELIWKSLMGKLNLDGALKSEIV